MYIKRRTFLETSSLATASLFVPGFLQAGEKNLKVPPGNKVAVVIQLSGGNDGLNTVIPVRDDIYYRERQKLAIAPEKALPLGTDAALHPGLTAFKTMYDSGELSILNSVGYPNPDRSHFRSMDIWHTGSGSETFLSSGWLGRYLDAQCRPGERPIQAMELDDVLSLALKGDRCKGLAFRDPRQLAGATQEQFFREINATHPAHDEHLPVGYLYKTLAETISSADYIFKQSRLRPSTGNYPATALGKKLKTISSLILSDISTRVYYVSLGSFDTHVNQEATQRRLFAELNDAVKAFTDDLKNNGRFEDLLLFTFSEFGRRVAQNASGGTDHGTANNMFFIGGGLKRKGLLNALPDLAHLQDGDLRHQVDFRDVYATVLHQWLQTDHTRILGATAKVLDFL